MALTTSGWVFQLFLNGKQIKTLVGSARVHGRQDSGCVTTDRSSRYTAKFLVPYAAGDLTAKSFVGGVEQANRTFSTAGPATALRLVADRSTISASRADLSYVVAEVVDSHGVVVACADEHSGSSCSPPVVSFTVSGAGELAAVGSGDPIDPSSFSGPARKTYRGRATAIVRPAGTSAGVAPSAGAITVTASVEGLAKATATITTQ